MFSLSVQQSVEMRVVNDAAAGADTCVPVCTHVLVPLGRGHAGPRGPSTSSLCRACRTAFQSSCRQKRGARLCSPRAALIAVACTHMEALAHPAPAQGIKPLRAPPHICCGFCFFFFFFNSNFRKIRFYIRALEYLWA